MIRLADDGDIDRIIEMGSRSLAEGPYKDELGDNQEVTTNLAKLLIDNPMARILVSDENGELNGLFAMVIFPHYYSGEITAGELMWYVEPEHRKDSTALNLWFSATGLAKELGATKMQMTAPTEEVGRMYEMRHYKKIETVYQKAL